MTLTRRDLLKALVKPGGLKGLTISRGAALEPGGFVTEIRGLRRPSAPYAETADLQAAQVRNELVDEFVGSVGHGVRHFQSGRQGVSARGGC